MSKHKVRHNKTCLNCGSFVDKHYCPHCGQHNSDSRQTFHHLFIHFVSDFIHYDGAFWRTTKLLFLYPGRLSTKYMEGKRKSYVNPFSFYIFVSFITFLIPSLLPKVPDSYNQGEKMTQLIVKGDTVPPSEARKPVTVKINKNIMDIIEADSLTSKKVDSWYRSQPKEDQPIKPEGTFYSTIVSVLGNVGDKDKAEKTVEFFINNLSKVLFIYMPIFAFWLWLFHNKKKRYYFDSGIFTLHFFSVVLLSITICQILSCAFDWLNWGGYSIWLWILMFLYITFYFFRGNRIFYRERRLISHPKSFLLIGINNFFIFLILILYGIFTVIKVYGVQNI